MIGLENKKIIIATHVDSTGPSQNFLEFCLLKKSGQVLFLGHPLFPNESSKGSQWQFYENSILTDEYVQIAKKRQDIFHFFYHFLLNIFWAFKIKGRIDLYVGSDNLNALSGIILRWLGKTKNVVYYTIDYVPERFPNKYLNSFYHWVDIFCVKHADIVWNLSPRMIEAREKYYNLNKKYRKRQMLVPEGIWFNRIKRLPFEKIKSKQLVFVGHLVPRLGVEKVIEAIPRIIKKIPQFKFVVIGKGVQREDLENKTRKLGIDQYVEFTGFIPDHREVEKIIAESAMGIAPYSDEEKSLSYYCDPSKTKIYMGCGLPVIMTDIFYNADEIRQVGAGKIVAFEADDIARAVIKIMSDEDALRHYKECAVRYAEKLDWDNIFTRSLAESHNE